MAETAKKRTAAKAPPPAPALVPAAASGDPVVHQILAELQSARLNGDDARASELAGRLAELGYE